MAEPGRIGSSPPMALTMRLYDRRSAPKRSGTWSVYALVDSRQPNLIRYLGITNNPRARLSLHISQSPKEGWKKSRWISAVIANGGDILMRLLACELEQAAAMEMEVRLIAEMRSQGVPLMNLTDGGDGCRGVRQSPETRAKKSAALAGRPKPPEAIARQAESQRGRKASVQQRARMSASHKARYEADPGLRDRRRTETLQRFAAPEARAAVSIAVRARYEKVEAREAQSETMRSYFAANPDTVARALKTKRHRGPQSNNCTGYKGVRFDKRRGTFAASIRIAGQTLNLGIFPSAESAAAAYDAAAISAWRGDCFLNFKQSQTVS